jgi:hypothetical protein
MDRELRLGEAQAGFIGGQVHEEELQQPEVTEFRGLVPEPPEPGGQRLEARRGDRERR